MKRIVLWLIVLSVLSGGPAAVTAQKTAFPPLPELKFAEIVRKENFLGDRWSYMEAGAAGRPTIVALHGAGGNSMDWRFQLAGLSKKFRVVAWNAPGYLLSDGFRTENPGCREFADALADFLDALKLDRVYLLGNSFGSRVAQCFAMNYPQRIVKMAFVGVSTGPSNLPDAVKNRIIAQRTEQIRDGGFAFGAKRVGELVGPNTAPELLRLIGEAMKATNRRAFLQVTTGFVLADGYSPAEVGAKVRTPTLLIGGDADKITPVAENAAILHRELKNSRLVILKNIGHVPHLEDAKTVNALVGAFFLEK